MASNKPATKSGAPRKASKKTNASRPSSPTKTPVNKANSSQKTSTSAPSKKASSKAANAKSPSPNKPLQKPVSLLAVMVDGAFLEDDAARSLWTEFSAYLDVNRNDFDGFAKSKGFAKVVPEHRQGRAVLVISNN